MLLEQDNGQDDEQFDIGPLDHYTGPISFNTDIKEILDHAQFLKSQAEQADVLELVMSSNSLRGDNLASGPDIQDVHQALLIIACEEFLDNRRVDVAYKRLKRLMGSTWD